MGKDLSKTTHCIFFCNGGSCTKKGAWEITNEIRAYIKSEGLYDSIHTVKTFCNGRCEDAPTMVVQPENTWYKNITVKKGLEIVEKHFKKGNPVKEYTLYEPGMKTVQSNNPLPPPKPKVYQKINDTQLGLIEMAQADPWEQNLYPMVKDIFQKFADKIIFSVDDFSDAQSINSPVVIDYHNGWASIHNNEFELQLAIGILAKDSPMELREERIGYVEVFKTLELPQKTGVRFRTKRGACRLVVFSSDPQHLFWKHFNEIYLSLNRKLEDNLLPV